MTATQNFWTTDRIMHLLIGLAIAAALILLIDYLSDALLPFFAACFISYMLQPLVLLNRRLLHEPGRVFSSLLTIIEVTAIITLIIYIFLPSAPSSTTSKPDADPSHPNSQPSSTTSTPTSTPPTSANSSQAPTSNQSSTKAPHSSEHHSA